VLEAFIAQALVAHEATSCITEVMFDDARERARDLDKLFEKTGRVVGPLHGVPISVKVYDIKGYDTTIGLAKYINKPAQSTADVKRTNNSIETPPQLVQSMISAGAIPFLKTNIPQTLYSFECSNPIWGRTSNPYNAEYSSGGSSGGEASMLALDAAVIGLGSDIAGSLRSPASSCGIYSFKPGVGRISDYGAKESFPGFDGIKSVCGPMARCMDDLELACRVSFGGGRGVAPVKFREVKLPEKLRFGYYASDGVIKASPACIRAVHETVGALERQGHECIELNQDLTADIFNTYIQLTSADGYRTLLKDIGSNEPLDPSLYLLTLLPKVPQIIRNILARVIRTFAGDKAMSDLMRLGGERTVERYHAACLRRNEIKEEFYRRFWDAYNLDGIITHVHASPACSHGRSQKIPLMAGSTCTYNLVDSPCGVVPVTHVKAKTDGITEEWINGPGRGTSAMTESNLCFSKGKRIYDDVKMDGMPVGVQVVGRLWEDEKVLAMMRVVDEALGVQRERGFKPGSWEERLQ
ncbi:amidase signature domain-containing protein, partial [Roridomyces roridus]